MNTLCPLISIITVSYNSQSTIEETILSVLNQSYRNIEYIIIDGASKDNTLNIIKKYEQIFEEQGIKFSYLSASDNGIYDAMNKGLLLAKGDWIGIINSDDFYQPEAFQKLVENINQMTETDLFYGNLNLVDENSVITNVMSPQIKLSDMVHTMSIFHPTVFVKSSVYKKYGVFDLKYKLSADWDLLKRFYLAGLIFRHIDSPVANFRKGGAGSGFKTVHLTERLNIRHKSFKIKFLFYDLKDILILIYYKIYPNRSVF